MARQLDRSEAFCRRFGLRVPLLLAPMAGVPAPALSVAVMRAGGLGACGALLMQPDAIAGWALEVRRGFEGPFQFNLWIPDPEPARDAAAEAKVRAFLAAWGPAVPPEAGDARPPSFPAQWSAVLDAAPAVVSSIMGVHPADGVAELKRRGIAWFANATTVAEARAAADAGADAIVAQGMEAGGHRGSFDAASAERSQAGLFALLPAVVDAVDIPVIATGGIADARGIAAALLLGASAVQIGTGLLRTDEAGIAPAWADALGAAAPEDTVLTRAFSGRAGRALANAYVRAATVPDAPPPAPYPVQRGLTAPMRREAAGRGDIDRMQAWAGQSAALARTGSAETIVRELWREAVDLLA